MCRSLTWWCAMCHFYLRKLKFDFPSMFLLFAPLAHLSRMSCRRNSSSTFAHFASLILVALFCLPLHFFEKEYNSFEEFEMITKERTLIPALNNHQELSLTVDPFFSSSHRSTTMCFFFQFTYNASSFLINERTKFEIS